MYGALLPEAEDPVGGSARFPRFDNRSENMRRILTAALLIVAATVGPATTLDAGPVHRCFDDEVAARMLATGQWQLSNVILCVEGYTGLTQVEHPVP